MSYILMAETAGTPATPSAGKVKKWPTTDSFPLWKGMDDSATQALFQQMLLTTTTADFTGTNVNTAQPVFNTTEDTFTLPGLMSYMFEGQYHIETVGTTSHQLGILFGGTATLTSIGYQAQSSNAATEVLGAISNIWIAVATVVNVSPATATATHHSVLLKGIVRVNAGGTFIPQYQWSAAPGTAGLTLKNSYFALWPFGSNTAASVGPLG